MNQKITLIAGLAAAALTLPASTAHAETSEWMAVASLGSVTHWACQVPGVNGTTVRSALMGDGAVARAGLTVTKHDSKLVSSITSILLVDQSAVYDEIFVPNGSKYVLTEWLDLGDPTTAVTTTVRADLLVLC